MSENNSSSSISQSLSLPNVKANWKTCSSTTTGETTSSSELLLFEKLIHTDDIENYDTSTKTKKGFVVFEKKSDDNSDDPNDELPKYFEITIEFDYLIEWTSIDIFSTARTVELYTSREREYGQTSRFSEKIGQDTAATAYHCVCSDGNQSSNHKRAAIHSNFTIKFLSLDYPDRIAKQTKICVSAIIFHGKRRGEKINPSLTAATTKIGGGSGESESTQFSGAMSALMSDPRMLMKLMNGMNDPTAKQMSMVIGQIMPITKTIDSVAEERKTVEQQELLPPPPKPSLPMSPPDRIDSMDRMENLSKISDRPDLLNEFKSKEDLRNYINECVDERMKQWEDRLMNKMMGEVGKFASPFLQGMGNPFAGLFRPPTMMTMSNNTIPQSNIQQPTQFNSMNSNPIGGGDIGKLIANIQSGKLPENVPIPEKAEQITQPPPEESNQILIVNNDETVNNSTTNENKEPIAESEEESTPEVD